MSNTIHSFDDDGYYAGSAELPPFAAGHNPEEATTKPPPEFDPETERARWVAGDWTVELIPLPEPEPEPEPEPTPPQYPRFLGNEKLNLFTRDEQVSVAQAASQDPVVALTFYRMINAAYMTYEDPETEQGLSLLVSKGLLTQERKAEIVEAMQPR